MAAATWKMMTDSPLTFAGERGVAVVRALECLWEKGGAVSANNEMREKKKKECRKKDIICLLEMTSPSVFQRHAISMKVGERARLERWGKVRSEVKQ